MPILHLFVNPIADEPGFLGTKPSDWNALHTGSIVNSDVDPSAAIVESKLLLNFPTHATVTLGTGSANGLSLVGQQLSLALSASGTTGALSGADWSTFNSKQATITFPIASNLGGTGVNNSGTITNASNTTITGGGTVALGGFTLTVPATGTVDLLGTAQTISATKTFTAAQIIDLSADAIGLTIQGAATQTNPLLTLELSTGTDVLSVDGTGRITQAATSIDHTDDIHNSMQTVTTVGTNLSTSQNFAYDFLGEIVNTVAVSRIWTAARFLSKIGGGATTTWTGSSTVQGGEFRAEIESSSSISVPNAVGGQFMVASPSNRASWIATAAIAGRFAISLQSNAAHTTASAISLLAQTHVKNANITITTSYGLKVESQTVAATNYAIFTELGLVNFGDQVFIDGSADRIQLRVQAHSTQTTSIVTIENSSAGVLAGFDSLGRVFSYGNPSVTTNFLAGGAGNATISGANNVFIGFEAGRVTSSGTLNVGIGQGALYALSTGGTNFALGRDTLTGITTQSGNVAVGDSALRNGTTLADNVVVGAQAGQSVTGMGNVMAGVRAGGLGGSVRTGVNENVLLGYQAGRSVASEGSVAVGSNAGFALTTGAKNIFVGYSAGYNQTTLSNLLIVDNVQRASAAVEITNAILYGVMAATSASQTLRINAVTSIYGGLIGNEDGGTVEDFRWETDSYDGIFLDASNNSVAIMSNAAGKIGFYGATAVIQPAAANQAALTNSTTGTYDGTLADVGIVFSQSAINDNFTDIYALLTEIRTALVNTGLIKGAA